MSIDDLLTDDAVALHFRQRLEPVDGRDLAIFPPTYVTPKDGEHRHGTPYTINVLSDGTRTVSLDSVQSQGNRMESCFSGEFADCVPQIGVRAGDKTVMLTDLSHRLADASIRATELEGDIHRAFEDYAAGSQVSIARLCPTALVYGAWDSRDTRVKIPRLIRAEIVANDVDVFTRSAQFSGSFDRAHVGMDEKEWKQGANVGFAPTPSVDQHGGVQVRGDILQSAAIHLGAVRHLESGVLSQYVLGLALVGLMHGGRDYNLRSGCWLVPDGEAKIQLVRRDGTRSDVDVDDVSEYLHKVAAAAKENLNVPIGAVPAIYEFDENKAKKDLKKKVD